MTTKKQQSLSDAVSLKAGGINAVTDAKNTKPFIERVLVGVDNNITPYISIVAFILALTYTAVSIIAKLEWLPEKAQGAAVLLVVAFLSSRAIKKLSK